ncbi:MULTISPECIES: hypothetical protein [Streptomyces]|uniref:Uncharacterized protein n=1 Tax=Streptomyces mutomycini TaxID=284036 RepID=A0ABW0B5Q4_9ACTN|nr:hypothetical protein [Streptomyces sp. NRRL S-15]
MLGDERFDRPQDFDLGVYWVSYLDDFQARCYIGTATVRLLPGNAGACSATLPLRW